LQDNLTGELEKCQPKHAAALEKFTEEWPENHIAFGRTTVSRTESAEEQSRRKLTDNQYGSNSEGGQIGTFAGGP